MINGSENSLIMTVQRVWDNDNSSKNNLMTIVSHQVHEYINYAIIWWPGAILDALLSPDYLCIIRQGQTAFWTSRWGWEVQL